MNHHTRLFPILLVLTVLALSVRPAPCAQDAATPFTLQAARELAQPELEATFGPVTYKDAEAYAGLDGKVAAWALEYDSRQWNTVSALVTPAAGLREPEVKTWHGQPCHKNADMLAAASLVVYDRLGMRVALPERCLWLGEGGLWGVYAEKDPKTGQPIQINLLTRQLGTPSTQAAAPQARAKLGGLFFDGEVDYPSGDDITWLRGQSYTVKWSGYDSDRVEIGLYKGLVLKESHETDNDGSTKWTVDEDISLGSDYRIRISATDNPLDVDWSDHDFAIASASRHVIYPSDSGITWKRGNTYTVRWEGFSGDEVRIGLYLGALLVQSRTTDNDGSYGWDVDNALLSSSEYKIRVSERDNASRYDMSDKSFKITGSSAKVKYPTDSGVTWKRGKKYTVKWSGFDGDDVRVELWKGNTLKGYKVVDNNGSTSWNVSNSLSKGSDYKIKISMALNPLQYDWSDHSFKIQ